MINHPIELIGLLEILWKDDGRDETLRLAEYDERSHVIQHQDVSIDPKAMKANLAYLDPVRYKPFASSRQGELMPPETAASVLPIVLSIVQLGRTIADEIDCGNNRHIRIGADIPPYDIHTVELAMTSTQVFEYYRVHEVNTHFLDRGIDEDTGDGRLNVFKHRRLQYATLLDRLASISTVKQVNA